MEYRVVEMFSAYAFQDELNRCVEQGWIIVQMQCFQLVTPYDGTQYIAVMRRAK